MHPKSNSFFARMSEEDKKKGDGSNPQCGILDEYHAHPTSEYYDIITSGQKTRQQPLLMIITTAGFELNNPCYAEEYKYVSRILNPDDEVNNDRYFAMVNELDMDDEGNLIDDISDEKVWLKCNPIVAKTPEGLESIRDELKVATDKPEKMRDFMTKTMNVWLNQRACGYMNMAKWKLCGATKEKPFPDLTGRACVYGVDMTDAINFASVAFVFELDNGELAIKSHSFMPEATYISRMGEDKKVAFDVWKKSGWLSIVPGDVIDDDFIMQYIEDERQKNEWELRNFGFNASNMLQFSNRMNNEYGHEAIEVPQGLGSISEPTKNFRERTYAKKIIHDNNPVLSWAVGNAVTSKNAQGNIRIDKSKSVDYVDPITALINAHFLVVRKIMPYIYQGIQSTCD